jgi:hypothetical protein
MLIAKTTLPDAAEQIETHCRALFERWCETRHVVPLAYLMHAWPMAAPVPRLAGRLAQSLQTLMHLHADALDVEDCRLVEEAISIAERIWRTR